VVQQQRVTVVPSTKPAAGKSPQNFPKESTADRLGAKDRQRQTLERELQQEEALLADAKRKLADQEQIRTWRREELREGCSSGCNRTRMRSKCTARTSKR
jgi:hypothetical protein